MSISRDLVELVREELDKGVPEEKIRKILLQKGYKKSEVDAIFEKGSKKREKHLLGRYAVALVVLVVLVAGAAVVLSPNFAQNSQQGKVPESQPQEKTFSEFLSRGTPGLVSYQIPEPGGEGVTITQRNTLPVSCRSDGGIVCAEPVLDTFFAENSETGIARFEQWVYMLLHNREDLEATIESVQITGENAEVCGSAGGGLSVRPESSERAVVVCINPANPLEFSETATVTYSIAGTQRTSTITLETG